MPWVSGWIARCLAEPPLELVTELSDVTQEAYDGAADDVISEMLRLAEKRHDALLLMASAADARAAQMVAGSAALATAAFGAAAALAGAGKWPDIVAGSAAAGLMLSVGAGFAAWAARPEKAYLPPGLEPAQIWHESILEASRRHLCLVALGESQRAIARAAAGTRSRARALRAALAAVTVAPAVSVAVWLVARVAG